MTQMGIEYQKLLETRRSNQANEQLKGATLAEDIRHHDLQRQTSLDVAATQASASRYATDKNAENARMAAMLNAGNAKYAADKQAENARYAADSAYNASKYAADMKTYSGIYNAGSNDLERVMNGIGFFWDTLI